MRLADVRFVVAATLLTALPCAVQAQWSSDPANNLVIADRDNEQVQPKMVPTGDGGFYISWFDNATGGYDVYLQRIDAGGNELWPHNGILVADRNFSSTEDYGLDIDADGNALLAFGFEEAGVAQVLAQKVSPDGTLLWGDPGVYVSSDTGDTHAPKISATGDGGIVVGWTSGDGAVAVQKLDGDGNPLWGASGITIDPASGIFFFADVHGDADGSAIVSWVPYIGQSHELWTQKLAAADGSALWGTDPVEVFDGSGGALQFGNFPPFISDRNGGAVFVWYTVGATGQVRAQHVMSDGSQAFAQNGVLASSDSSQNHFEPDGAYDPASGDIYALWRETDVLTQLQIGVYAQRFDSTGARQWGDSGLVLVPLSSLDQTEMTALPVAGGGLIAAWSSDDYPNPTPLHAARLDTAGDYVWPSQVVDFSTEPNDTGRLTGAISTEGFFAYAWTANAASFAGDIHAQNINPDGTLGVTVTITDRIFANGFDP
ncbi:MAG TPA: hypothetical protein VFV97_10705 [Rhodanobacteraceae bacterium]|nr:hypothetical protein [Rhodanobacteraceae bacterium]